MLAFIGYTAIDIIGAPIGSQKLFNSINDFFKILELPSSFLTALLVAAAAVPLGFMIYQLYFYVRWTSPFSRDGLLPPFIGGTMDDLKNILRGIPAQELALGQEWRREWVKHPAFEEDHTFRWHYMNAFLAEIIPRLDAQNSSKLHERHRYLMDLMHGLGASITAIELGFLGYLVLKVRIESIPVLLYLWFAIAGLIVLLLLIAQEDKAKRRRQSHERESQGRVSGVVYSLTLPRAIFNSARISVGQPAFLLVASLGVFLFLVSPTLAPVSTLTEYDILLRVLLVVIGVWSWLKATKPSKEDAWERDEERRGIAIWATTTVAVNLLLLWQRDNWLKWLDWSFAFPVFLFLITHLILVKGRQNARDDLIALEHYALRRFLEAQAAATVSAKDTKES
jgi:hypothetical protein